MIRRYIIYHHSRLELFRHSQTGYTISTKILPGKPLCQPQTLGYWSQSLLQLLVTYYIHHQTPAPPQQLSALEYPWIRKTTPWSIFARINAPPQYHQDYQRHCCCGAFESPQHLVGICPVSAQFWSQIIPNFLQVAHSILPNVLAEVSQSLYVEYRTALSSSGQDDHPIPRLKPPSCLPKPFPPLMISADHWLVLPGLRWSAFTAPQISSNSRTAVEFQRIWELAAGLLLYFLVIARHDEAYTNNIWPLGQFTTAFNGEFRTYSNALLPPDLLLCPCLDRLMLINTDHSSTALLQPQLVHAQAPTGVLGNSPRSH
ncbi:hypothetical protein DL89DRAFT_257044 [Linderina pennispora]|uniref:Uncharacterized protein n=1 Tax=Linderina pennispora TaxID=61395 RepID=A0A1Y1WBF0_9FUNG|nr:uncharacterized protein DL89DRAFT_257044 [Linderina pennispora]ORX70869.1 hypothetical protein DL89DRAFT_257044 [Linderina pennispora]